MDKLIKDIKENHASLVASFDSAKATINGPFDEISKQTAELEHLQEASEILRHMVRFLTLGKRLESLDFDQIAQSQDKMEVNLEYIKTALVVRQMEKILESENLKDIHVIEKRLEMVKNAREKVLAMGSTTMERGLGTQVGHSIFLSSTI